MGGYFFFSRKVNRLMQRELLKNLVSIETPSADREANERIAAHLDTYCDTVLDK